MTITFGVEIEFLPATNLATTESLAAILSTQSGLSTRGAYRGTPTSRAWKIVKDSSVRWQPSGPGGAAEIGFEAVSPILREADFNQIDKVCRALSSIGARVNRTCGLHIHIGGPTLNVDVMKRLAVLYAEVEPWLDSLLPPSRRESRNSFCVSVKEHINLQQVVGATTAADIAQGIARASRYTKLNFTSYWRHGTVEFRQHSGTIDPEKIKHWAWLCKQLLLTAVRETSAPRVPPATNTGGQIPEPEGYWRTGRRTRVIWRALNRPDGVTEEELRQLLNVAALPNISVHVRRAGGTDRFARTEERREGRRVWKRVGAPAVAPSVSRPTISTLEGFLEYLQVAPEQRTYWIERAALLNEPVA